MKLIELCDEIIEVTKDGAPIDKEYMLNDSWMSEQTPVLARACKLMIQQLVIMKSMPEAQMSYVRWANSLLREVDKLTEWK